MSSFLLNIAVKNVNSLTNKTYYVNSICLDLNLHIFAITESWLRPCISDATIHIPNYYILRNDFISPRPKHGVCIYVHNSIKTILCDTTDQSCNTLSIFLPTFNVYVVVIYRPPSNSHLDNNDLINYLLLQFSLGREVIIVGDFNLPSISWDLSEPDLNITPLDASFYNLFTSLGLHQHVRSPTFLPSGNILDLVFTSDPDRVVNIQCHPPFPHCHHTLIQFSYLFQKLSPPPYFCSIP